MPDEFRTGTIYAIFLKVALAKRDQAWPDNYILVLMLSSEGDAIVHNVTLKNTTFAGDHDGTEEERRE